MPVPTDQLVDDIKDLSHRLGGRLDGQEQSFREMRDEFTRLRESFIVFRTRINTIFAIASAVLLLTAGALIMGVLTYQYERGKTEAVVSNQLASMERLEKRFDELRLIGDRLDRLSQDYAQLQGRLEREGLPPKR
jgi:hypothetical protein